jgi:tRNA threonylcarbamoyladenosine biosynthesis protein TsaB
MIIALHTATPTCFLSVYEGTVWREFDWEAGRQLAKELLGRIDAALGQVGADSLNELKGIIVYEGPGSYTGLRIGLTVANTLADSLSIPIVGTTNEAWRQEGLQRLQRDENDQIVMPVYGGDPHITTPRK